MPGQALELLRKHWGHEQFRPGQAGIIHAAAEGQDVLALLPTGGGKSVCYQIPGLLRGGLTVVISPLIALMQDQVLGLRQRGLAATYINSSLSQREINRRLAECQDGQHHFLFLAPERLSSELLRQSLPRLDVRLVAVDEAHCISQWGFNFRPAYRRIRDFRGLLPGVPFMALTATAPPQVQQDIARQLLMRQPFFHAGSFARPNLRYAVLYEEDKRGKMLEILEKVPGSGVIYLRNRRGCDELAAFLRDAGHNASSYHAGLPPSEREWRQNAWVSGRIRIMVATNAFGMGIDKPDVRLVLHEQLPADLESYYQEAGRAGRDGQRSYAVAFHSRQDAQALAQGLDERYPGRSAIEAVYQAVGNLLQIRRGQCSHAWQPLDLTQVETRSQLSRRAVNECLRILQQREILALKPPIQQQDLFRLKLRPARLKSLRHRQPDFHATLEAFLRTYGGELFQGRLPVELPVVAAQLNIEVPELRSRIEHMARLDWAEWQPVSPWPLAWLQVERRMVLDQRLLDLEEMEFLKQQAYFRLKQVMRYADDLNRCRSVALSTYFGEESPQPCGVCDVCTGRHQEALSKGRFADIRQQLLDWLGKGDVAYFELLTREGTGTREQREHVLRELLQQGELFLTPSLEVSRERPQRV